MIKGAEPISSKDFNKGLVTRSDFLKGDIQASPNTMDVTWNFDASLQKRFGCSSVNTIAIGSTALAGWLLDNPTSLTTSLISYWKMDEASGTRLDQVNMNHFTAINNPLSQSGIRNNAVVFASNQSQGLIANSNTKLQVGGTSWTIAGWFYLANTSGSEQTLIAKRNISDSPEFSIIYHASSAKFLFTAFTGGSFGYGTNNAILSDSFGAVTNTGWYFIAAFVNSGAVNNFGISVNLSTSSASFTGLITSSSGYLNVGGVYDNNNFVSGMINTGLADEVGFWKTGLKQNQLATLYGNGTGNTYSSGENSGYSWASFDFGASNIRWLTVAAGTGIYASSNLGTTFVNITSSGPGQRTQNYQSFTRSKNVLIATSDSYDPTLYWAGSTGTVSQVLAPNSAPAAKFAVNYQGFLILLNFMNSNNVIRNRGFSYADENLQLTDTWQNSFDIPSSADDEITASFILYKFLYISTRYTIYRVAFVGGNPDWSYLKVKDWGFVPRTVQIVSLKGGGQVALGMDWDRRIRAFDGFDDMFVSDNIENDNGICDFAMDKVSYAGSGLLVSHAILNPITQEYRLNVAIGSESTQTTHGILLNARNLAFYPYSNQQWQTMCMAQSNNQNYLMAADRSGFVYILDSGNLDVKTPINEMYDSPPLFSKIPETVSKGREIDMFFATRSSGIIYYQERFNLSNTWGELKRLTDKRGVAEMTGTENLIKLTRTMDVKATYNTYQFRITSNFGTATPWSLDRIDYLQHGFGIGQG